MNGSLLIALVVTAVTALAGTAFLRRHAHAWGLIDIPNERSLHLRPTPRGGGIALVVAFCLGLAVANLTGVVELDRGALVVMGAALAVAAVGWRDDIKSLPAAARLAVHLLAAVAVIATLGAFDRVQLPGTGEWRLSIALALVATAIWLVGLLNAYNFMDGIDSIAAGQAVVAGAIWAWLAGERLPLVGTIAMLVVASSAGFLWHNWPPARIFMGDAGSGFLGFIFAVLPLLAYHATADPRMMPAGIMIVWPFAFDAAFTLARRVVRAENVVRAHRTHLYQRLVTSGWSHRRVSLLYLSLGSVCGIATGVWLRGGTGWLVVVAALLVVSLPVLVDAVETGKRA